MGGTFQFLAVIWVCVPGQLGVEALYVGLTDPAPASVPRDPVLFPLLLPYLQPTERGQENRGRLVT